MKKDLSGYYRDEVYVIINLQKVLIFYLIKQKRNLVSWKVGCLNDLFKEVKYKIINELKMKYF